MVQTPPLPLCGTDNTLVQFPPLSAERNISPSTVPATPSPAELKVIAEILYEDTKAEIKFLGIQPKNVNLGTKMCEEVKTSARSIIAQIKKGV